MAVCITCGGPANFVTGKNEVAKGVACDDCYYGALGELVEEHPIVSPHRPGTRGCSGDEKGTDKQTE
jgi:hypothetical protein